MTGRSHRAPRHGRARAVAAFLVLPGTVALLVPWLLRPAATPLRATGLVPLGLGLALLLRCVRDFHVAGRGTLAPWAPPERLVVVGLYRVTRNPMYVAVLLILAGWAHAYGSRRLWLYAAVVAVAFHLRVVFGEEPWLARRYGLQWTRYRERVPRWLFFLSRGRAPDLAARRLTRRRRPPGSFPVVARRRPGSSSRSVSRRSVRTTDAPR